MLESYPKFKKGQVEAIFKKLSKKQKEELENLLLYREGRGMPGIKLKDLRRFILQIYYIIEGTFKDKISDEKTAIKLSLLITHSYFSIGVKKNLLVDIANLLKYIFPDWTLRFKNLEMFSIKQFNKGDNSEPKDYEVLTDEEIKNIYRAESKTFYKAFLKIAEQTGARTKEVRTIQNTKIEFDNDGTASIEIYMTKIGKKKIVFVDSETAKLIKQLQEEQKNIGRFGKYLFHSPKNTEQPISKNQVCFWFGNLTLKAINKRCIPYMLRHRRASILYKLAKENKISKDTAIDLMGHSKDMSERYTHISDAERKKILKEQAFRLELPEEKKHELEIKIKNLTDRIEQLEENRKLSKKAINLQNQILLKTILQIKGLKQEERKKAEELIQRFSKLN